MRDTLAKTTVKAVETLDLTEMLAALCQVAQDAGDAGGVPQMVEKQRIAFELPATDQGGNLP